MHESSIDDSSVNSEPNQSLFFDGFSRLWLFPGVRTEAAGLTADFVVRDALADGQLVEVLGDYTSEGGHFNLLWPSGRQVTPKLRAFIDFFSAHMPLTR